MKIIKPIEILNSHITNCSIEEEPPNAWSNSITYSIGDLVLATSTWTIYESLTDTNLNQEPTASPTYWQYVGEAPPLAYSAATSYSVGDLVTVIDNHKIYESLVDTNLNNYPPDNTGGDIPKWLEISATMPWKIFDQKLHSLSTSFSNTLEYTITPNSLVTGLALFNLFGKNLSISVTDPIGGEVYSTEVNLISVEEVFDWKSYFFEDISYTTDLVLSDLPAYKNASILISLTGGVGEQVYIGELVLGKIIDIGGTQYAPSFSIIDYSKKSVDTFGNYQVIERAYSKRTEFSIVLENGKINSISKLLAELRAQPIVWIATENKIYSNTLLTYGYYRDFSIIIPHPIFSEINLTVEGLT